MLPFLTSLKHTGVSGSRTAIRVVLASGQFQSPTEKFLLEQGSCVTSVHLPFRLFCVDDLLALLESVSAPFWSGLLVVLLLTLRVLLLWHEASMSPRVTRIGWSFDFEAGAHLETDPVSPVLTLLFFDGLGACHRETALGFRPFFAPFVPL